MPVPMFSTLLVHFKHGAECSGPIETLPVMALIYLVVTARKTLPPLFSLCVGPQIKTQWSVLHPSVCLPEEREWTPSMTLEPTTGLRVRAMCSWQVHNSTTAAVRGEGEGWCCSCFHSRILQMWRVYSFLVYYC